MFLILLPLFILVSFSFMQPDHIIQSGNFYYSPSQLTINIGETVEWYNEGGYHDVNGELNSITNTSFNNPVSFYIDPVSGPATIGSYTFDIPGVYNYDCSIGSHAANGMIGSITVVGNVEGCTDPSSYNCEDDDGINYSFEVGALNYVNGCNYDLDDYSQLIYVGGCEDGPCSGYYNPEATTDDGTCDYYQAPVQEDVEFLVSDNGINIDWSNFSPPQNSEVLGYILQRCTSTCVFVTGSPFPWPNGSGIGYLNMSFFDEYDWQNDLEICGDECNGEIKYAINVHYSNAENFGMAIGASYINPNEDEECSTLGDLNGDGGNNVLDIVALANCILGNYCEDLENGCAGDLNGDGGYNVLDIVALANCILSNNCAN